MDVVLSNREVREQLNKMAISRRLFERASIMYANNQRIPFSTDLPNLAAAGRNKHRFLCIACERHHGLPSTVRHIGSTLPCNIKNESPDWSGWRPCPWAVFGIDFIQRCLKPMRHGKRQHGSESADSSMMALELPVQESPLPAIPCRTAKALVPNTQMLGLEGVLQLLHSIEGDVVARHQHTLALLNSIRQDVISGHLSGPTPVDSSGHSTITLHLPVHGSAQSLAAHGPAPAASVPFGHAEEPLSPEDAS